jgi:hypothetical protein
MVIGSANEGFEIWSLLPRVYERSFPFAVYPVIAGEEGLIALDHVKPIGIR